MTVSAENRQYGILIYDIPTNNMKLYMRVYGMIRKRAILLNKSVYLIQWGWREGIKILIDEAVRETGQVLTASFLPFDQNANDQVAEMAKVALARDIRECLERLNKKVASVLSDAEARVNGSFYEGIKDQLKNIQALAVMFGFEGSIEGILASTREVIQVQWDRVPTTRIQR